MPRNLTNIEVLHDKFNPEIDNSWMYNMSRAITENKWKTPDSLYGASFFLKSAYKYVHFPHIDPDDANKIRFTESLVNGRKGRFTSMRIGRYLTKHFKDQIGSEGNILSAQQMIVYETAPVEVFFASTEEEVVECYTKGPRSCMSKSMEQFQADVHPCTAYLAGDLQIAWTMNQEGTGPGARVVVWPEKLQYGRIYGDTARLSRGLHNLGYKKVSHMAGARIKRIPYRGTFTVPYVDGDARIVQPALDIGDTMILRTSDMVNGAYEAYQLGSEWGWLWEPTSVCAVCEVVGSTGDRISSRVLHDAYGNRSHITLCGEHRDRDSLAHVCLLYCDRCGNAHQPHVHEYEPYPDTGLVVCARCVIRSRN